MARHTVLVGERAAHQQLKSRVWIVKAAGCHFLTHIYKMSMNKNTGLEWLLRLCDYHLYKVSDLHAHMSFNVTWPDEWKQRERAVEMLQMETCHSTIFRQRKTWQWVFCLCIMLFTEILEGNIIIIEICPVSLHVGIKLQTKSLQVCLIVSDRYYRNNK